MTTDKEIAARLRQLVNEFDPPPAPIRLPSGDMTLDEAARIVKGLHGSLNGAPNLQLRVWLRYDPPHVDWRVGASLKDSGEFGTLREAVEDLKAKLTPKVEGSIAGLQEVLDAATERQSSVARAVA